MNRPQRASDRGNDRYQHSKGAEKCCTISKGGIGCSEKHNITKEQVPVLLEIDDGSDDDTVATTANDDSDDVTIATTADDLLDDMMTFEDGVLHCPHEPDVTYPSKTNQPGDDAPAIISQYDDAPAGNTRASRRKKLLAAIDVSRSCPTARQTTARSFPMQFLADFAGAVLDDETGEILEYCHLIKRPKYKKRLGILFRQRNWPTGPGHARTKYGHKQNILHRQRQNSRRQMERSGVQPHRMQRAATKR